MDPFPQIPFHIYNSSSMRSKKEKKRDKAE